MLTFLTTAESFRGHDGIIQRNALKRCLQLRPVRGGGGASALAQDFPREEREILVVDDGSTDDTAARMRRFGNAIRYLYKANGGQASAFNYGFANARGEVIALLDADDVWLPEKLSRLGEVFERNPDTGMAYHRLFWWDGTNETEADRYFIPVSGRVPESRSALLQYLRQHIMPDVSAEGIGEVTASARSFAFSGGRFPRRDGHFCCADCGR